jgi:hypothetical protein
VAPAGTPNAYESYGVYELYSSNPNVPPAQLGMWSDDDPNGLHPITRLRAGTPGTSGVEPSLFLYVTNRPLPQGGTEAVYDLYADRIYLGAPYVHSPGRLLMAGGLEAPSFQSAAGVPLVGVRSGVHAYNEGTGGNRTSVLDLYGSRMWLGGGGVMNGDTSIYLGAEIRSTVGMRSKFHAWDVDVFTLTYKQPTASWTGPLCHYAIRGGYCHLTFRGDRVGTTWAAGTPILQLPAAAWPLVSLDVAAVHPTTGVSVGGIRIREGDGQVYTIGSGSGGASFSATFPVKDY